MESFKKQQRDINGNLNTELDPIRARTSYSAAATDYHGTAGVQIMTNASGFGLYLDRVHIQELSSNAGVVTLYDGTVALGTPIFQASLASLGTIDITELGTIKASSTSGLYLKITSSTSTDVHMSFFEDVGTVE